MIDKFIGWAVFVLACFFGVYVVLVVIWINERRDQLRKEMKRKGCGDD